MSSLAAPPKLTRAKRRTPREHGGEGCGGWARIELKTMNRPKRTYLTLTGPITQYRSAPIDGTCTGGSRAPNQEGQWEMEVLKMGAETGEVPSASCDNRRGVRKGWIGERLKLRVLRGRRLNNGVHKPGQCRDVETTSRHDRETINQTSRH